MGRVVAKLDKKATIFITLFLGIFGVKLALFSSLLLLDYNLAALLALGGGSDADYYDAYARGEADLATSLWPILLRWLHDLGFYSRNGVILVLFLMGNLFVPLMVGRLAVAGLGRGGESLRVFWLGALVVSLYPTLFFFTLDMYRDVFMMFTVLIAFMAFRRSLGVSSLSIKLLWLGVYLIGAYATFLLRPYLGFSVLIAWPVIHVLTRIRLRWYTVLFFVVIYLTSLVVGHRLGLFDPLYEYRGVEGFEEGVSSFGLSFLLGDSIAHFLYVFVVSFMYQVFGLYFASWKALLLFATESLPFLLMASAVWKRRLVLDRFSKYVIAFAVIYSTIFVLGNDNLGTAARLRMFAYIAIAIVWLRTYLLSKGIPPRLFGR